MKIVNSIIVLQPGMYILRHPKGGLPPLSVSRTPASAGKLETLSTTQTQGAILRDGADCIVMHVTDAPVELLVSAYLPSAHAVAPVIKIDEIALDAANPAAPAPSKQAIAISGKGLSIIGHIERIGDMVAGEGQRLGEADSPLRLEGFQVMWPDRPEGVDLTYGIAVEGAGTLPTAKIGKFCGSRGEARRITEVTFALVGSQAAQFELDGTAYFSGGFQIPISSGMALSGPSGLEHLTSLSLRVLAIRQTQRKTKNPWDDSSQTKIFKAKTEAPQKIAAKKLTAKPVKPTAKTKLA